MTPAELKKLKVAQLKEQLKERGLDTTGKKDELVARLESALADEPAASTEQAAAASDEQAAAPAAPASELLPKTAVEALHATDFVLASAEHAKNCQSVCKLLFDIGAQRPSHPERAVCSLASRALLLRAQGSSTSCSRSGRCQASCSTASTRTACGGSSSCGTSLCSRTCARRRGYLPLPLPLTLPIPLTLTLTLALALTLSRT